MGVRKECRQSQYLSIFHVPDSEISMTSISAVPKLTPVVCYNITESYGDTVSVKRGIGAPKQQTLLKAGSKLPKPTGIFSLNIVCSDSLL